MNKQIRTITFTVMFAVINYAAIAYGKISISIAGGNPLPFISPMPW